jgi:hypothetical protein
MTEITATPSTRRRRPEAVCHVCRSRRLRPSVAKCVPRETDRGDGVDAEQRSLGSRGNDSGRRASLGPLSGQRKPRPRLSPWVGTASSCTKLPGRVPVPVKPLGQARDGRQQRDGPCRRVRACGTPSDLVDGRGELYERCGRRTRYAASSKRCGSARWRARTRRVRAQPRTSRACCCSRRFEILRPRLRLHAGRFVK